MASMRCGTSPKSAGQPLWKLLADMRPRDLVRCIDFRYIADELDRAMKRSKFST